MKCIHADAEGFCTNQEMQGGGFKCFKCLGSKPSKEKTQMAKNKKVEVVEAEVVEENRAVAVVKKTQQPTEGVVVKTIAKQIAVVQGAELRSNFEKLKLGAMVSVAVRQLKLEDPAANRGRNAAGGGALGWWSDVCPRDKDGHPVIAYRTVMKWKEAAERLSEMMAVGGGKSESIMVTLSKNPKKAVGKDAKILASAEKLANGMTMRQMLLWGGDAEPDKGRRGRPKGTKADLGKKPDTNNTIEAARAVWSGVIVPADRTLPALTAAVELLNAADVANAKTVLQNLMDLLNAREQELKTEIR